MEPSDLFSTLALCNRMLDAVERAGIVEAALRMHERGLLGGARLAEEARVRAGYGRMQRELDRAARGLPRGRL